MQHGTHGNLGRRGGGTYYGRDVGFAVVGVALLRIVEIRLAAAFAPGLFNGGGVVSHVGVVDIVGVGGGGCSGR